MHRINIAIIAVVFACASGCAYGYAGREGHVKSDEPEPEQDSSVVEVEKKTVQTSTDPAPKDPESPCGVETFEIHRFDNSSRVTRTIDCRKREVIEVERAPIGNSQLQEARRRGLPQGEWYLLVDPEGLRAKYLSNAELLRIRREYQLGFVDKDRENNLMIYRFNGTLEDTGDNGSD